MTTDSAPLQGRVDRRAPTLPVAEPVGSEEERLARLELSLVTEPGHPRLTELVALHGAVETRERIRAGDGPAPPAWRSALRRGLEARVERMLADAEPSDRRWVCPGDDEWPGRLDDLMHVEALQERGGVPLGLWVRGPHSLAELSQPVAVVGSRACTEYGAQIAGDIGAGCAERDIAVVSGAAFGIDAAAHRGALALGGVTVAVLACGVDVAYPTAHQPLIDRIASEGLVLSELCPGTRPSRVRFLARNRLIAAVASGAVVVEAARRSGALNTLNWAARLGRHTMGVPGPVTSSASAGVHQVIRDGGAILVTGGDEVAEVVAPLGSATVGWVPGERRLTDGLAPDELAVLEAVPGRRAVSVHVIAADAHLDVDTATSVLGRLLCSQHVERTGIGWRLSRRTARALRRRWHGCRAPLARRVAARLVRVSRAAGTGVAPRWHGEWRRHAATPTSFARRVGLSSHDRHRTVRTWVPATAAAATSIHGRGCWPTTSSIYEPSGTCRPTPFGPI